jgi:hypothetical protein
LQLYTISVYNLKIATHIEPWRVYSEVNTGRIYGWRTLAVGPGHDVMSHPPRYKTITFPSLVLFIYALGK